MTEMTRIMKKQMRSRCFGGSLKGGALCQWLLWLNGRHSTDSTVRTIEQSFTDDSLVQFLLVKCKRFQDCKQIVCSKCVQAQEAEPASEGCQKFQSKDALLRFRMQKQFQETTEHFLCILAHSKVRTLSYISLEISWQKKGNRLKHSHQPYSFTI